MLSRRSCYVWDDSVRANARQFLSMFADFTFANIKGARKRLVPTRTRADPHLVGDLASHHIIRDVLVRCSEVHQRNDTKTLMTMELMRCITPAKVGDPIVIVSLTTMYTETLTRRKHPNLMLIKGQIRHERRSSYIILLPRCLGYDDWYSAILLHHQHAFSTDVRPKYPCMPICESDISHFTPNSPVAPRRIRALA
jgi:hypothetical protein